MPPVIKSFKWVISFNDRLKSFDLKGEVITTPFKYVATAHAIECLGLNPVFCDVKEDDYNINPEKKRL